MSQAIIPKGLKRWLNGLWSNDVRPPKTRVLAGPATSRIRPSVTPLWRQRGWEEKKEGQLHGTYRTRTSGVYGLVILRGGDAGESVPSFYIYKPPAWLLASSHGPCYRKRGDAGWYWVHFRSAGNTVDAGIAAIEQQLSGLEGVTQ